MAEIFRKSLMDKFLSPEQLDKTIAITSPSFWIAMLGSLIVVIVALVWSIVGRLPVQVDGNGIFLNAEGISSVYAESAGIVMSINVAEGDSVKEGQTLITLGDSSLSEQLNQLLDRIDAVEAVTLTSEQDKVTSDNQTLVDIKLEYKTANSSVEQVQTSLTAAQSKLSSAQKAESAAQTAMNSTKQAYYNLLGTSSDTNVQAEYEKAQTALSTAQSEVQQYQEAIASAEGSYSEAASSYISLLVSYASDSSKADYLYSELCSGLSGNSGLPSPYDYFENVSFQEVGGPNTPMTSPEKALELYSDYLTGLSAYQSTMETVQPLLDTALTTLKSAQSRLSQAESAYLNATNASNSNSAALTKAQNEYQLAATKYSTAQSVRESMEQTVQQYEVQLQTEQDKVRDSIALLQERFDAGKQAILSQLDSEVDNSSFEMEKTIVTASVDGTVTDLQVKVGSIVNSGTEMLRVTANSQADAKDMFVCYIPLESGKKAESGMQVMIYPTTYNKQEYGYVEATVVQVDSFVTSQAKLLTQLGDETLVNSFLQDGPVIALTCQITEDLSTSSGYKWSSKKGAALDISTGTIAGVSIVVEEKAPITMLIPLLKEKLSMGKEG